MFKKLFWLIILIYLQHEQNEPPHDKINNVAVRPEKTQLSLGVPPSLIRVLAVHWVGS